MTPTDVLVQSDAATGTLIRGILQEIFTDVIVQVVRTPFEALDYLFATGQFASRDPQAIPALILLDVTSEAGGLAALKVIKLYIQTHRVPVIMIADTADHHAVSTGYRLGASGCIPRSTSGEYFKTNTALITRYWLKVQTDSANRTQNSTQAQV